jgi:alpha-D-ribose 1-methylphosphonate 5-triphosphate synthase subunit PhnG
MPVNVSEGPSPTRAAEEGRAIESSAADTIARQRWMGLLARARPERLAALVEGLGRAIDALPACTILRGPEHGLVMVRGRAGATGAPFNLGEMTVTRCSVRLASGAVGHAYVGGRSGEQARQAAVVDAMLSAGEQAETIERLVIGPLEREERERREAQARKSAATRVEFFTMVRSEA